MKLQTEVVVDRRGEKKMAGLADQLYIQRPRTCKGEDGTKFTTYEIVIETKHIAFSLPRSSVRRRFSEFAWLRSQLVHYYPERTPPSLPPKTFFTSRFDPDVIENRKTALQEFLLDLLEEPVYSSDGFVHLFLQSVLPVSDIEDCMEGRTGKSIQDTILDNASLCSGGDNDSGIVTCSCDSAVSDQSACLDCLHVPVTLEHYPSNDSLSSYNIFSPTVSHPMPFPGQANSASKCLCTNWQGQGQGQCQGQCHTVTEGHNLNIDTRKTRSPVMSSTPLEICRIEDCKCNTGGLLSPSMSIEASSESSTSGESSGLDCLSSIDETESEKNDTDQLSDRKKKVTFSQEVTVAKILDRV